MAPAGIVGISSGNFYSEGVTISKLARVVPAYPNPGVQDGVRGQTGRREWHGSCKFPGRPRPGMHKS
jgi:hypothetical protein